MVRVGRARVVAGIVAIAAAVAAAVLLVAGPLTDGSTSGDGAGSRLPPSGRRALTALFREELEPFGLRITRAVLQSLETYERDPRGTHLALYVEPISDSYTDAQYIENFTELTRTFVPDVFERWSGLESFDICQEPLGDDRESPPPVTQIFVHRDALDRVARWRSASLVDLLAASPSVPRTSAGYYVYFAPDVRDEPQLEEAAARAGWKPPPDPPAGG